LTIPEQRTKNIDKSAKRGNAMGFALNSGRMAAENALKYMKSIAQ
jgi:hypothetical protein